MNCVSCDRPLICSSCSTAFAPKSEADYRAMHEPETAVVCPECAAPLVCRLCGRAYSGDEGEFGEE